MKWRPQGWINPWANPNHKLLYFKNMDLDKLVSDRFEAGADAMLEALRKEGYETSQGDGMRLLFGTDVFIPDDPQPSEKPVEKQLMICPKVKTCIKTEPRFCGHDSPHKIKSNCSNTAGNCAACVPYVPEKETISGWWLNHITGNKEFATINIPPFIKVKIEDNQGYHLQHPASKVIESGYLEIVFGKGLVEVPKLSCTFTRN